MATESCLKYISPGSIDLYVEFFRGTSGFNYKVKLSHFYLLNGELVADPSFEIDIDDHFETAEALTYQDLCVSIKIHNIMSAMTTHDISAWKETLNSFLESWLDKIIESGYKLDLEEWFG